MTRLITLLTLAYTLLCQTSVAQVCSSGLGDAIVNVSFGSGTDSFGPLLSSSITPMTYERTTCPEGSADSVVVFNSVTPGIGIALNGGHVCADSAVNLTAAEKVAVFYDMVMPNTFTPTGLPHPRLRALRGRAPTQPVDTGHFRPLSAHLTQPTMSTTGFVKTRSTSSSVRTSRRLPAC